MPAFAAAAEMRTQAATLRLVALEPDGGRIRGTLEIGLAPGWKTYWIAPGPAGLPPRLDFRRSTGLSPPTVSYPVPRRFEDGDAESVGYDGPTSFAFEAQADGAAPPVVRLDLVIGVCRDICVPLQASLETVAGSNLSARAAVAAAFSGLPDEAPAPAIGRVALAADAGSIAVSLPALGRPDSGADLFVAGPAGWSFGRPVRQEPSSAADSIDFRVPVDGRPKAIGGPLVVDLLLTSGEIARLSRSLEIERP